jgi:hypothetical protein
MKLKLLFLTALLFPVGSVRAQDFRKAMMALHEHYQNKNKLEISMRVKAFESKESDMPFYTNDVSVKKSGRKYLYRFATNEMLMNENYTLIIDHAAKEIVLSKRDPGAEEQFQRQTRFSLDSILSFYEDGQYLGNKNGIDTYSVVQKIGSIEKIELSVDHATSSLKGLTYLYRTSQFVSIIFDHFDGEPLLDEAIFDEWNFVRKEGKVLKPAIRFAGYTVTDINKKNPAATKP